MESRQLNSGLEFYQFRARCVAWRQLCRRGAIVRLEDLHGPLQILQVLRDLRVPDTRINSAQPLNDRTIRLRRAGPWRRESSSHPPLWRPNL